MRAFLLLALLAAALPSTSAHGYLSSPPPRGIQKASYQVDDLKSPNHKGMCRGEPVGQITKVHSGQSLTLGFTITAPHVGPCRVTILDADLTNERPVAEKMDCAAPGKVGPWVVQLPKDCSGHKVLRWYWEGRHVSPAEPYEQCIDLDFGGGDGGSDADNEAPALPPPQSSQPSQPSFSQPSQPSFSQPSQPSQPSFQPPPPPVTPASSYPGGACNAGSYMCNNDDNGFSQCANGSWVKMGCAAGTACRPASPTTIVCDRADTASSSGPSFGGSGSQPLNAPSPQEGPAQIPSR